MSSESNISFTTKFNGDLLTFRGDDATAFGLNVSAFLADQSLTGLLVEIQALSGLGAAFRGTPAPAAPPPTSASPWETGGHYSPAVAPWDATAANPQVASLPSGFACVHGARTYRTGNGAKGKWEAYFCPHGEKAMQCKPMDAKGALWK